MNSSKQASAFRAMMDKIETTIEARHAFAQTKDNEWLEGDVGSAFEEATAAMQTSFDGMEDAADALDNVVSAEDC